MFPKIRIRKVVKTRQKVKRFLPLSAKKMPLRSRRINSPGAGRSGRSVEDDYF